MEEAAEPGLLHIVDATGLKCPLPVLLARRALKAHIRVRLVTTDPASVIDVPVFCSQHGFEAEGRQHAGKWEWLITRSPAQAGNPK